MIQLQVITKTEAQALEIADFLLQEKLILNAIILKSAMIRELSKEGGSMVSSKQTLLLGQTKALLFTSIDRTLRGKYPDNVPVIYSLPIAGMDWEQADSLISGTAKV